MSDWAPVVDPSSGSTYYYNSVTQETSWTDPNAVAVDAASAWTEVTDPSSGQIYYYNSVTQETAWEKPAAAATAVAPAPVAAVSIPRQPSVSSRQAATPVASAAPNLLPARKSKGSVTVPRRSILPSSATGKRAAKVPQSLDEQLAARARKFIQQRRLEKNGNKPAAFATLARRQGVSVAPDAGDAALSSDWQEVVHAETGQTYYYNAVTGVTSWEKP